MSQTKPDLGHIFLGANPPERYGLTLTGFHAETTRGLVEAQ